MDEITVRECTTIEEFDGCVYLQREAFGLPDLELSPRRHLIVSRQAGGWTLGAFVAERMVGFVHHLAAVRGNNEVFGYSHVMAVAKDYQNKGVGARLKWAQRERALGEGRKLIKWTWDPMMARNAHFNLNRLGAIVDTYSDNFYGMDYNLEQAIGLPSDRLSATWHLDSERVRALAQRSSVAERTSVAESTSQLVESTSQEGGLPPLSEQRGQAPFLTGFSSTVAIPSEWSALVKQDPQRARDEQARVRAEFKKAFEQNLICAGFERGAKESRYLLYKSL